jgi:hypothetical protein
MPHATVCLDDNIRSVWWEQIAPFLTKLLSESPSYFICVVRDGGSTPWIIYISAESEKSDDWLESVCREVLKRTSIQQITIVFSLGEELRIYGGCCLIDDPGMMYGIAKFRDMGGQC